MNFMNINYINLKFKGILKFFIKKKERFSQRGIY